MKVKYKKKYLERCFRKKEEGIKRWGKSVAQNYIKRMNIVYAAISVDDLYAFPQLDFHSLKGKHSIKVTERARLIVMVENKTTIIIENMSTKHYE